VLNVVYLIREMIATHTFNTFISVTSSTGWSFIFAQMGMQVGGGSILVLQVRFFGAKLMVSFAWKTLVH